MAEENRLSGEMGKGIGVGTTYPNGRDRRVQGAPDSQQLLLHLFDYVIMQLFDYLII